MLKWLGILFGTPRSVVARRGDLVLENLALRQQLAVLKHANPRPRLTGGDRFFWVSASRLWAGWREVLHIVQPATVIRSARTPCVGSSRATSRITTVHAHIFPYTRTLR
jgi:hypothetical protein